MADRVSSDHPSVETVRATLEKTATGVRLELPTHETESFPVDEVVRVVLDGTERFARIDRDLRGDGAVVPGVFDAPRIAREPREADEATDRLPAWANEHGVETGGSVHVDVVAPEFLYGLRAPGETAVYDAREPPSESLASIAEDVERGNGE